MHMETMRYCLIYLFCFLCADAEAIAVADEFIPLQLSPMCPNGTSLSDNGTLYGLNVAIYWYPWLRHVFPLCSSALQHLLCRRRVDAPCRRDCVAAVQWCWMLDQFVEKTSHVSYGHNDVLNCSRYSSVDGCGRDGRGDVAMNLEVCASQLHESYEDEDDEIVKKPDESQYPQEQQHEQYHYSSRNNTITGCSLLCDSPLHVHQPNDLNISVPILVLASIGFLLSFFTILTFLVDWRCQNRYPALILFILNCLFIACFFGWVIQYLGVGNVIGCSPQNYRRAREPRYRGASWCIISFTLIYFSSVAIGCWFVILAYSWYVSFQALGSTMNRVSGKVKYYHMTAWSTAFLATAVVAFLGEVDAHEFTNICFVGYRSQSARVVFVYIPFVLMLLLGELFMVYSIAVLWRVHVDCRLFILPRATDNILHTVYRLAGYALVMVVVVMLPLTCCVHEDATRDVWRQRYNKYIRCRIVSQHVRDHPWYYKGCEQPDERNLVYFYVNVLSLFLGCVATNSWTWTSATGRIWYNCWKRFGSGVTDAHTQLQISWYLRMQKKKIAPFIPPLNPDNPLESVVSRRTSDQMCVMSVLHSLQQHKLNSNLPQQQQRRRFSDDIRSVFELFSARRGTKGSVESEPHRRFPVHAVGRSLSVASMQNYGHLGNGAFFNQKHHNNNNHQQERGDSSNLTVTHMKNIHDNLLTPISMAHRNSIVADCIPYSFMRRMSQPTRPQQPQPLPHTTMLVHSIPQHPQTMSNVAGWVNQSFDPPSVDIVDQIDDPFVDGAAESRHVESHEEVVKLDVNRCFVDQGMEPCSVDSSDDV